MQFIVYLLVVYCHISSVIGRADEYLDIADQLMSQNRYEEAITAFNNALNYRSNDLYAMQGVATALASIGRFDDAGKVFEKAAMISNMAQFYMNAGMVYSEGHNIIRSLTSFQNCLKLDSRFRPCHIKIANIYNRMEQYNEVQKHLNYAIQLDPNEPSAYIYLGDIYNNLKQFNLAIITYKKSLNINPINGEVCGDIAMSYNNLKQYDNALEYYNKAILYYNISKNNLPLEIQIGKLFTSLHIAYWKDYERDIHLIMRQLTQRLSISIDSGTSSIDDKELANYVSPLSPYQALFLPLSSNLFAKISQSWKYGTVSTYRNAEYLTEKSQFCNSNNDKLSQRVLKIGYISRRFEDYPGTQMMLRLFSSYNRSNVFVYAYAHGPSDNSTYREFITQHSDYFIDISNYTTIQSIELIRNHSLDVLIDYDGIHDFNSLKVLLHRVSDIQLTWLGFAGTTGFDSNNGIDYMLADTTIIPPDTLSHTYTEKMIYLHTTYQPQDEYLGSSLEMQENAKLSIKTEIRNLWSEVDRKHQIRDYILRNFQLNYIENSMLVDSFWYICFNRIAKVSPDVFSDWMNILSRSNHAKSVLVLMSESMSADNQIKKYALYYGIHPTRIIFLKRMERNMYLKTLAVSDIFLDTFYYDAHTTASDGLVGALPVLTLPGPLFASRVASSLNNAMDLDTVLNVNSRKEYHDTAADVLTNIDVLNSLRHKIYEKHGKNLFNSTLFSQQLVYSYQAVVESKSVTLESTYPKMYHVVL